MKLIFKSAVSVCIEREDYTPYYSQSEDVGYLNGELFYSTSCR